MIFSYFKRLSPIFILVSGAGIGGACLLYKENIKTYLRLREKIHAELPKDYVPRNLEARLSKLLRNPGIQGIHVLYEPRGSGKTTAIKKVLKEMQDENASGTLMLHNGDNQRFEQTIALKPMYVDMNTRSLEWEDELGKETRGSFINTIPENTKMIVVMDHMTRDVIDGFDCYGIDPGTNWKAGHYFTYYAPFSYNTGFKFVIVVVTNDREYAKNILQCNGCQKVHQIVTDHDPGSNLYREAIKESTQKLTSYMEKRATNPQES